MKKIVKALFTGLFILFATNFSFAQCTPGDVITCPDIENNGEICPDTLPGLTQGIFYSESVTILPPPEVEVIPGFPVPLHHIQIKDIENLPPGIGWISNDPDTVFMVGTYYCILLDGTPTDTGAYFLKIVVDAYIPGFGGSDPVFLGTTIDSTSVLLTVLEGQGNIIEPEYGDLCFINAIPNPFSGNTEIKFFTKEKSEIEFLIFDLVGKQIHRQSLFVSAGENSIHYDGSDLPKGMYIFSVSGKTSRFTNTFIKID